MSYKYFGLLAVILLFLGLLFIVLKWPLGKHATFSQHVALRKRSLLYYILMFSVTLPPLLLFFLLWFVPTFGLSVWFSVFVIIASITQYVCAFFPETGGWKTRYHRLLTAISAVSLLLSFWPLFLSVHIPTLGKAMVIGSAVVMVGIIGILILEKGKHSHFLLLQCVYYLAYFTPILYISYGQ